MDTDTHAGTDAGTGVATLAGLLREAEEHHGTYEPVGPPHHWWDWYAGYVVARQAGRSPEDAVADATAVIEGPRP